MEAGRARHSINTQPAADSSLDCPFFPPELPSSALERLHRLTPQMRKALDGAAGQFNIRVYEKEVAPGDIRTVVLAGETHIKGRKASDRGIDLLKAFPVRGLEGVEMDRTLCDRIAGFIMTPHFFLLRMAATGISFWFRRKAVHTEEPEKNNSIIRGSTIQDALSVKAVAPDGTEVEPLNIHLEKGGIRLNFLGEMSKLVTSLPFLWIELRLVSALAGFIPYYGPIIQAGIGGACDSIFNMSMAATMAGVLSLFIPKKYRKTNFFSSIFHTLQIKNEWILNQRNELIVANLTKHVEEDKYGLPVLNLVGAGHIAGLGDLLECRGWKRKDEQKK